ncbi:MAG TPA: hypothetical protein VF392_08475 [Terracidiphilus sp.]
MTEMFENALPLADGALHSAVVPDGNEPGVPCATRSPDGPYTY